MANSQEKQEDVPSTQNKPCWRPEPQWPQPENARYVENPAAKIPIAFDGDVAVIGGGTAGVMAAIAAAREGAKTAVIERLGVLGGCPVTDLMASYGPMFYDEKWGLILKGLAYELTERVMKAGGTKFDNMHDVIVGRYGIPYTVPFNPEIMGRVMTEMVQEAGVKIFLHSHFSHILGPKMRPTGVVVVNKSGRQAVLAKSFVDTSGDCDFMRAAGAPVTRKSSRWGLLFRMINVDFDKVVSHLAKKRPWEENPDFMNWLAKETGASLEDLKDCPNFLWGGIKDPVRYNHQPRQFRHNHEDLARPETIKYILDRWKADGFVYNFENRLLRDEIRQAVENGDIDLEKDVPGFGKMHFNWDGFAFGAWGPGVALVNSVHSSWFDPTSGDHVTVAEIEARERCIQTANFYKKYIPGFENAEIMDIGQQNISRYGIFIDSMGDFDPEKSLTDQPDTVGLVAFTQGEIGDVHRIPLSMLVPKKVENALAAGKHAGAAQPVRGILACFAMGQAAGTAAAMIAKKGINTRDIDIKELQSRLKAQDVILRPEDGERL